MKAIVQDAYGSTDVLESRDIDKPGIADDEVLIEVRGSKVSRFEPGDEVFGIGKGTY